MSISKAQIQKYFEVLSSIQNRTYRGYAPDVISLLEARKANIPGLNSRMVHNVAAGSIRNFIILNAIAEVVKQKEDELEESIQDPAEFKLKSA
jgi:hypothetical protein